MHRPIARAILLAAATLLTACGSSVRDPATVADLRSGDYTGILGLRAGHWLPDDSPELAELRQAASRSDGQRGWDETLHMRLAPGSDLHAVSIHIARKQVQSILCELPPIERDATHADWQQRYGLRLERLVGLGIYHLWFSTTLPAVWCAIPTGAGGQIAPEVLIGPANLEGLRFHTRIGAIDSVEEHSLAAIVPLISLPLFADQGSQQLRQRIAELQSRRQALIAAARTPADLLRAIAGADAETRGLVLDRLRREAASHSSAGRIASSVGRELLVRHLDRPAALLWEGRLDSGREGSEALARTVGLCLPELVVVPDPAAAGAEALRAMLEERIPALRLVQARPGAGRLTLHVVEAGAFTPADRPVRRAARVANAQALADWQAAETEHAREVERWQAIEAANRNHSGFTEKVVGQWSVNRPVDIGRVDGTTNVTQTTNYQQVERTPWRDEAMAQRHAEATAKLAALAAKRRAPRPPETIDTTVMATERTWSGALRLEGEVVGTLRRTTWERDASILRPSYSDQGALPTQEEVSTGPRDALLSEFAARAREHYLHPFSLGLEKHLATLAGSSPEERAAEAAWMRLLLGIAPLPEDQREIPAELRERIRPPYRAPRLRP
jgi:hypothetical protein